jgi:hypothetical protein
MLFCIFLQILIAYYAAQLLTGFAQWFQYNYLAHWPLAALGLDQRALVAYRWWETLLTTVPFLIVLFLFGAALLGTSAFAYALSLIILFANEYQRLAHLRPADLLQRLGFWAWVEALLARLVHVRAIY